MYNKKNSGLKVVGIVVGTVTGVAAIAAGAVMLYKRYFERKVISCCEFGRCNDDYDCECGNDCTAECEVVADATALEDSNVQS